MRSKQLDNARTNLGLKPFAFLLAHLGFRHVLGCREDAEAMS
jgi:hypothetical protein